MRQRGAIKYLIFGIVGNLLILFVILALIATFGPALYYEISFRIIELRGVHYTVQQPNISGFGEILRQQSSLNKKSSGLQGFASILIGPKEQILIPKDTEFSILIPKFGVNSRVFPNINPADSNDFLPVLQKGIAHAKGTLFPGSKGNIYLFAHSADNFWDAGRYNAVFYLLKDLTPQDEIVIFFQDKRYNYTVINLKILDPKDVGYITSAKTGKEVLILQTCWPPGTTWKRLLVFARPK